MLDIGSSNHTAAIGRAVLSSAPAHLLRQAPPLEANACKTARNRQLTMPSARSRTLLATAYQRYARDPADPAGAGGAASQQKALITRGNRALMN